MNQTSVIITAGGIGKRMNASIPKQFIEVNGTPILIHTIQRFYAYDANFQFVLTLPEDWFDFWDALCEKHGFEIPHTVVAGGKERYHSIKNALDVCTGAFIFVHDGVRPFVSDTTLNNCLNSLKLSEAVIPVVPVSQSIRQITENGSKSVNRSAFRIVQTPQCFQASTLRSAYELPFHDGITDDASLVESSGVEITMVPGNTENIKITTKTDLLFAEELVK